MMPEKLDFSSIVAIEAMFENFLQTLGLLHKGIGEVKLMSCLPRKTQDRKLFYANSVYI
jgi:hypothetical protein